MAKQLDYHQPWDSRLDAAFIPLDNGFPHHCLYTRRKWIGSCYYTAFFSFLSIKRQVVFNHAWKWKRKLTFWYIEIKTWKTFFVWVWKIIHTLGVDWMKLKYRILKIMVHQCFRTKSHLSSLNRLNH